MSHPSIEKPPEKRPRNRRWIWYFVVLILFSVAAVATITAYNLAQQLTLAELAAAQALWQERGPDDYELRYIKLIGSQKRSERIYVRVRDGKVTFATLNDVAIPSDRAGFYDVDGMFRDLRGFLESEQRGMEFLRAIFDDEDGHPKWYVRRLMWSDERVEIRVQELTRFPKE